MSKKDLDIKSVVREEMETIFPDERVKREVEMSPTEIEIGRLRQFLNNFYLRLPASDGVPDFWREDIRNLAYTTRQSTEQVLADFPNMSQLDIAELRGDREEARLQYLKDGHSERRITLTQQEFLDDVHKAIEEAGVALEDVHDFIDSMEQRKCYAPVRFGAEIACVNSPDGDYAGALKQACANLRKERPHKNNPWALEYIDAIEDAAENIEIETLEYLRVLLNGLKDQLTENLYPREKANQELLFPIYLKLREMGYSFKDLYT